MRLLVPAVLSCVILAAHFLRAGSWPGVLACLAVPLAALAARRNATLRALQGVLFLAPLIWLAVARTICLERVEEGRPFLRAGLIFAGIGAVSLWSALLLSKDEVRARFGR